MQPPIDEFATAEFIEDNKSFYDDYIDLRVQGFDPYSAFIRVFGMEHWPEQAHRGQARLNAIESTRYFNETFDAKLEKIKVTDLWNPKRSLNELLCVVRGPYVKDATKLNAIKELNVMVGIVIIDENGKTKAGRTLEDFYAMHDKADAKPAEKPAAPAGSEPKDGPKAG